MFCLGIIIELRSDAPLGLLMSRSSSASPAAAWPPVPCPSKRGTTGWIESWLACVTQEGGEGCGVVTAAVEHQCRLITISVPFTNSCHFTITFTVIRHLPLLPFHCTVIHGELLLPSLLVQVAEVRRCYCSSGQSCSTQHSILYVKYSSQIKQHSCQDAMSHFRIYANGSSSSSPSSL